MDKRYSTKHHSTYNLSYRIIFCPKYRRKVLVDGIDVRCKELLLQKATEHSWNIENLEVMSDHVHLFIKATPNDAPNFIVSQLKGYSSFILRKEFPLLKKKLPSLWTRGYYVESIGHISEGTIKKYIDDQKRQ